MGLSEIKTITEEICDLDRQRRERFQQEFDRFESENLEEFAETRAILDEERRKLETLDGQLKTEREEITDLDDKTEFLSVDQAVEHREESLEKLREHNRHLRIFCDSMRKGLEIVEENLQILETAGPESVSDSPEAAFETTEAALEAHNESVAGLTKNLTIFNAYITGV